MSKTKWSETSWQLGTDHVYIYYNTSNSYMSYRLVLEKTEFVSAKKTIHGRGFDWRSSLCCSKHRCFWKQTDSHMGIEASPAQKALPSSCSSTHFHQPYLLSIPSLCFILAASWELESNIVFFFIMIQIVAAGTRNWSFVFLPCLASLSLVMKFYRASKDSWS